MSCVVNYFAQSCVGLWQGNMTWYKEEDTTTYKVVVNHEEQYSIYPDHMDKQEVYKSSSET